MADPPAALQRIVALVEAEGEPAPDSPGAANAPDDAGTPPDSAPSEFGAEAMDLDIVKRCAALDQSDTDNGQRLIAHFGGDLTVMAQGGVSGGDWLGWDGRFWDLDNGQAMALRLAQRVGPRIAAEAAFVEGSPSERAAIERAAKLAKEDESDAAQEMRNAATAARKALKSRQSARWRFGVSSKNSGRIEAMLKMAAPHLRRDTSAFNADPMLVVTQSHTLIFRRDLDLECPDPDVERFRAHLEALAAHRREDLATGLVPCDYQPHAKAPKFEAFLDRCMPDKAIRRTVQQYSGTGLIGVLLQRLMFHHGFGANGKSVFLAVLTKLLGKSYAVGLPAESIIGDQARNAGGASPDIVRLFGKRMVRVDELPEGKPLHEDLVKRLTGGDEVAVRNLFKGYFDFANVATPHMSGNGFPKIDGTDNGIWRRMLVVHWSVTIPVEERREFDELVDDLLTEAPGILNWLIEGAIDFLEHGLVIAPQVLAATESYREDMDPIGRFVADCVESAPSEHVKARQMYEAYISWCKANALTPRYETKFGLEMKKRFTKDEKRTRSYLDCRLHDVPERPETPGHGPPYGAEEAYP